MCPARTSAIPGRSLMRQARLMAVAVACATIATATVVTTHIVHGQSSPPIYNPYPTGILPTDIASEETRGQTEISGIEQSCLAQCQALTPPVVAGNPPILMNTGYASQRILGGL